ncbi:hypothetical protein HYT45_04440 [Candidatus Uhrbacteria bacterium]|nr:hypothetical protein [Candidatus Uhrbacteria bacterium]
MKYGLLAGLIFGLCASILIFSETILFRYVGYGVIFGLYCGVGTALFISYLPGKLAAPLIRKAVDAKASPLSTIITAGLTTGISVLFAAYICRTYVWKVVKDIPTSPIVLTVVVAFLGYAISLLIVHRLKKKEEKAERL